MNIEFGLSQEHFNTKFAPLAALAVRFQHLQTLKPLENVQPEIKTVEFSAADKLTQVLISMLAGCEYISEVNTKLKPETILAAVWGFDRFSDQSNLSLTLDALQADQLTQLEHACGGCDACIRRDHDETAVPAVHQRAGEGAKYDLRQERGQRGGRQDSGQSGFLRQPPDQRELHQRRTDQREGLSAPDGEEFGRPAFGENSGGGGVFSHM